MPLCSCTDVAATKASAVRMEFVQAVQKLSKQLHVVAPTSLHVYWAYRHDVNSF